jgi:formate-dependent nitrite reductase membrane component NrfD
MPHDLNNPEWGWLIVLYFFFGGIAAGAYFSGALLELVGEPQDRVAVRVAHLITFPLLALCGILLILDLGRPERFWHMMVASETARPMLKWWSPMSLGSWALMLFSGMAFLSFVDAVLEQTRGRSFLHQGLLGKLWALAGSAVGFFFASYTGVLLGTTNFPVWTNSSWIGALFMASAASTGVATMLLVLLLRRRAPVGTRHKLEQADNLARLLELVLILVFVASLGALAFPFVSNPTGALLLWGGVVVLGLLVPIALHFVARGRAAAGALAALLLTLAGGLLLRYVVVMIPQGIFT